MILKRLLSQITENPKTSIAGLVAIAAVLFPHYAAQITAVAGGIGLLLSKDGDQGSTLPPKRVDDAVKNEERRP